MSGLSKTFSIYSSSASLDSLFFLPGLVTYSYTYNELFGKSLNYVGLYSQTGWE